MAWLFGCRGSSESENHAGFTVTKTCDQGANLLGSQKYQAEFSRNTVHPPTLDVASGTRNSEKGGSASRASISSSRPRRAAASAPRHVDAR